MFIYIFIFLLIFFLRSQLQTCYSRERENKYLNIVYAILVLLAALRYIIPGTDMMGYMHDYQKIKEMSWDSIIDAWDGNYVVYFFASKIFSYTQLPYQFWFGFVELFFLTGFARLVNKFSKDKLLTVFLFFSIGLYNFSFSGLKQVFAMSLIWHSFASFYDRKYFIAAISAVLSYFTHKTSAFFMLAFLFQFIRNKKLMYFIITAYAAIIIVSPNLLFLFLADSLNDSRYLLYLNESSSSSYTIFIVYLLLFIPVFIFRTPRTECSKDNFILANASISVVSQLLALVAATAFRLALYYTPFLLILFSNNVKDKTIKTIIIVFFMIFLLYTSRQFPYKFFWQ